MAMPVACICARAVSAGIEKSSQHSCFLLMRSRASRCASIAVAPWLRRIRSSPESGLFCVELAAQFVVQVDRRRASTAFLRQAPGSCESRHAGAALIFGRQRAQLLGAVPGAEDVDSTAARRRRWFQPAPGQRAKRSPASDKGAGDGRCVHWNGFHALFRGAAQFDKGANLPFAHYQEHTGAAALVQRFGKAFLVQFGKFLAQLAQFGLHLAMAGSLSIAWEKASVSLGREKVAAEEVAHAEAQHNCGSVPFGNQSKSRATLRTDAIAGQRVMNAGDRNLTGAGCAQDASANFSTIASTGHWFRTQTATSSSSRSPVPSCASVSVCRRFSATAASCASSASV